MDYESKYNELVEVSRSVVEGNPGLCNINKRLGRLRDLLPDKDSEDERIRQYVIIVVKDWWRKVAKVANDGKWPTEEEMLAYIEKQKDEAQKQFNLGIQAGKEEAMYEMEKEPHYSPLCNTIKDKIREYIANHFIADRVVKTDMKSIVKAMEEGVRLGKEEQKPTQNSNEREYIRALKSIVSDFIRDKKPEDVSFYQEIYDWLDGRHVEQKPAECVADSRKFDEGFKTGREVGFREGVESVKPEQKWDEEDEEMLEDIIFNFQFNKGEMTDALIAQYNRFFDKIMSLKPQSQQEWSEEEQQTISFAVDWLTKMLERTNVPEAKRDIESVILGLKSLRPQPKSGWRHYMWNINMRFNYSALVQYDDNQDFEIVFAGNRPKREVSGNYIFLKDICPQPHWKPSEEQMEALNKVIHEADLPIPERTKLMLLEDELKKLL